MKQVWRSGVYREMWLLAFDGNVCFLVKISSDGLFSYVTLRYVLYCERGTRWRSWVRHCATSRKVAGSIPDDVIGMFRWHNAFGGTVALGLTQSLTEMSTSNISWGGKGGRCVRLTNLTTFMRRLSWNLGASTSWNPQGLSRPVMVLLYLYLTVLRKQVVDNQDLKVYSVNKNILCYLNNVCFCNLYNFHP